MMERYASMSIRKLDEGYPQKRASSVELMLVDGRRFEGYIPNAKGEPEHLLRARILRRNLGLTCDYAGGWASWCAILVMRLEKLEDVSVLTAALKVGAQRRSRACHIV